MKTAILLIGHGSRAPEANEAMYQVAATLKDSQNGGIIECAFLEISQPDIGTGLSNCRQAGAEPSAGYSLLFAPGQPRPKRFAGPHWSVASSQPRY